MNFIYKVDYPSKTIWAIGETAHKLIFFGKAKCSPSDVFNVKTGKKIACLRAKKKQLKNLLKKTDEDIEEVLQILDIKNRRMEKIKSQILDINQELQEYEWKN